MKILFTLISAFLVGASTAYACAEHATEHTQVVHEDSACPIYFKNNQLCAEIEFAKGPFNGEESQFIVKFFDHASAHGEHVMKDPAHLKIDLWMNMGHHGHGSSPVKIVKQDQGVYFVSEAYFVMAGRWQVRFFVNGEQAQYNVDVEP
ncbi:FixH family protein [Bdellovibrio sp. 22V]|uniref:FixH family protein n=1 Tax=Bdellovibrio sp. 22V TaxID=3044166 RepID=UPI002543A058|nr:FixH family protein [Bdellovibrio sp. 22V]WII71624.1 FixH family protein [Bdellovibrio sp. 22V]